MYIVFIFDKTITSNNLIYLILIYVFNYIYFYVYFQGEDVDLESFGKKKKKKKRGGDALDDAQDDKENGKFSFIDNLKNNLHCPSIKFVHFILKKHIIKILNSNMLADCIELDPLDHEDTGHGKITKCMQNINQ